jgi:hypothetical protein
MNQALLEHYKFHPDSVHLRLIGEVSGRPGYFRFGEGLCYGVSSSGDGSEHRDDRLRDLLRDTQVVGSECQLPFNPGEMIDNFRFERYTASLNDNRRELYTHPAIMDAYYFLRPMMPAAMRRRLHKAAYHDFRKIPFPCWPVDCSVENIFEGLIPILLKSLGVDRIPFIWFWPEGKSSCVLVTHDVETRNGKDFCSELMDIDEAAGIKCCFQIVPEGGYAVEEDFLESIRSRGFEINVHDLNHNGKLFRSRQHFLKCANKINGYGRKFGALGFRSGALYRNLDWMDALEFSYDMSVPNVAHLEPQRGGCCTIMPFFAGKILEIPSTMAQDYALFHILKDYSLSLWRSQLNLIQKRHGVASVICHPDYMMGQKEQSVYRGLLELLCRLRDDRNSWVAQPAAVAEWWRNRSRMNLVPNGKEWRIEGPGCERARIAYACRVGDGVEYTLQ